jgi:uncharacterized membrane protein YhaH (DUF805 family)
MLTPFGVSLNAATWLFLGVRCLGAGPRPGRGRRAFWLGLLIFVLFGLGLSLLTLPLSRGAGPMVRLGGFLVSLGLLYPLAALVVKRLHDRNMPAKPWAYVYLAAVTVFSFVNTLKIGFVVRQIGSVTIETPGAAAYAVLVVCMLINLGMFIVLAFLRGTPGPNRFGPDPLQRTAAA